MISRLFELYLILSGTLAPASPNVLEDVANRRAVLFEQVENWHDYEVLAAVEDCDLLGRSGWLISDKVRSAIVVDCSQKKHNMNGIMADVNRGKVGQGWLVLR